MAATIAIARGFDSGRIKETHRLGSELSVAEANTWRTFVKCSVNRDGSGYVTVTRDHKEIHRFNFGPENE